ncbi:neo-calmodulin-like [Glandiceps talaboti]
METAVTFRVGVMEKYSSMTVNTGMEALVCGIGNVMKVVDVQLIILNGNLVQLYSETHSCSLNIVTMLDLKRAFKRFDKDGNGKIDTNELENVLKSLGQNPTEADVRDMIKKFDADGNGTIEVDEFVTTMQKVIKVPSCEEDVREAFNVFDADNSGYITADELRHVSALIGVGFSDDVVEEKIRKADTDGDGKVQYEEFLQFVKSTYKFK